MKISASIYSNNGKKLEDLVRELDAYQIDYFHIDCNDNLTVFDDIKKIREISKTPVDLHLITSSPEKYWERIRECGVELVTLQYEVLKERISIPNIEGVRYGLSLVSDTSVEVFNEYKEVCSFILFMTTVPGQSGGIFDKETFKRIRHFRSLFPDKKIHVDGGINAEVSFILRNMGIDSAVTGSYLFRGDFMGSAVMSLRSDNIGSRYKVGDFMLGIDEIPVLNSRGLNLPDVLNSIEEYRMGFTMIASEDGKLEGIISNADVRRGLIRNISALDMVEPRDLINRNPAYVCEENTVYEMLNYVKNLPFPVLFLPVTNKSGRISGAIKFNNLIKGES